MSIQKEIIEKTAAGQGLVIGYLPLGFPNLKDSIDAVVALANSGFDAIELGIPYSDPVMDGGIIQQAANQALSQGIRTADLFTAIKEIKKQVDIPVLVMAYYNLIYKFGVERFAGELKESGSSGLITPDLIPDEASEWIAAADSFELDRIFLASSTSTDARLKSIVENSRGFVYATSTLGVTGTRESLDSTAQELVARLQSAGSQQNCVGIGVSTPEHVRQVLSYADGAIIGSALVRALSEGGIAKLDSLAKELTIDKTIGSK